MTKRLVRWAKGAIGILCVVPALAWGEPAAPQETIPAERLSAESVQSEERPWFFRRWFNAYVEEFHPSPAVDSADPEPVRRALPAPWDSPPYPGGEYQGSPLIGVPVGTKEYPLMKALGGTSLGEWMRDYRLKTYGWVNGSYNWSNSSNSNQPTSYWIVPKSVVLEQAVLRIEREADTVQTDWLIGVLQQRHDRPFFAAMGMYAPHYPNYAPKKYYDLYPLDAIVLPPIAICNGIARDCLAAQALLAVCGAAETRAR